MKVVFAATLAGFNTKDNGDVNVKLKAPYSDIASAISTVQLMNRETAITVKVEGNVVQLGRVGFKRLTVYSDGESVVTLDGNIDSIDVAQLSQMHQKEMHVKLVASDDE